MVEARCVRCGAQLDVDEDVDDESMPMCPACTFVKTHCKSCGREVDDGSTEFDPFDGSPICEDCFHDSYGTCGECGNIFPVERLTAAHKHKTFGYSGTQDEILVCDECLCDYKKCANCNIWHEDGRVTYIERADKFVCNRCMEEDYFTCNKCEGIFPNDEYGDDGYCRSCNYDIHSEDAVEEADVSEVFNVNRSVGTINFKHDPEVDRILADPKSEL